MNFAKRMERKAAQTAEALGIGGKTTKTKPVYATPNPAPFHGTFAESKAEKDLRVSQKAVDEARAAVHAVDPNNVSAIRIAIKKMEATESHHHKVWIAHDKEVKATEAKAAKTHKGT